LRSACVETEAAWSVPIIPALANCIGDQTISTINNWQSVLAQTDFMEEVLGGKKEDVKIN
jgi:hypothetical protein